MNDEKDGVWRTINGAKVFIKNGQSVEQAFREKAIEAAKSKSTEQLKKELAFRIFSDKKSVDNFFLHNDDYEEWERFLTPHHRYVIQDYTMEGYSDINSYLRGYNNGNNYSTDYVKSQIKVLDSAISAFILHEPIIVYRSIDSDAFSLHLDNFEDLIGTEYNDKAFMSSSPSLDSTALNKDLLMTIKLPAGIGIGAYISEFSGLDNEIEFLIARNSKFIITKARKDKNIYKIEMELLK